MPVIFLHPSRSNLGFPTSPAFPSITGSREGGTSSLQLFRTSHPSQSPQNQDIINSNSSPARCRPIPADTCWQNQQQQVGFPLPASHYTQQQQHCNYWVMGAKSRNLPSQLSGPYPFKHAFLAPARRLQLCFNMAPTPQVFLSLTLTISQHRKMFWPSTCIVKITDLESSSQSLNILLVVFYFYFFNSKLAYGVGVGE